MSEEVCKKVFEPFFTTKAVGKGTGLGLSAVFGIARSLSGRVFCYSEKGNGTTFKIYLPAYEKGEVNSVDETESLPAIRGAETILIVDDEDKIRRLSGEVMESLGFSVLLAGSGEQAIEIYRSRSEEIDLVVLDLGMPGMGGFMCLKELISFDPEVKVIIASGYTQVNEIVKNSIREGAAGFISKPYKFADISRKVRTILDASG
jgi:CheY-like chemotaxis protein